MPARRGSPGRAPPPAGHGLLLPDRRAAAGRRPERLPDRPRAAREAQRALSPAHLRVHFTPTSPGAADPPPPPECRRSPSPCRCPCWCWCCARRPASGCSWCGGWGGGGEGKGTRRASAAPGPGEEVGRGAVSGALRECGAGWRWGARGAVRGAAAASGWGHIKFGGCGRWGGGAAGEELGTGAEPERPPPPPFHCDRRVRPRRRRRRRGAGAGGGGGRRAVAGGGGRNRPQLGPGQPPPPPSSRSPGERAANPRRPLRARPDPGRCAPASGRAFPHSPSSSLPLFLSPFPTARQVFKL